MLFRSELSGNRQEVRIVFYEKAPFRTENIPELVRQYNGALKFNASGRPSFTFMDRKKENKEPRQMLEKVKILLNTIKELLV